MWECRGREGGREGGGEVDSANSRANRLGEWTDHHEPDILAGETLLSKRHTYYYVWTYLSSESIFTCSEVKLALESSLKRVTACPVSWGSKMIGKGRSIALAFGGFHYSYISGVRW